MVATPGAYNDPMDLFPTASLPINSRHRALISSVRTPNNVAAFSVVNNTDVSPLYLHHC